MPPWPRRQRACLAQEWSCTPFSLQACPDSRIHGNYMGPHVGSMNFAIWESTDGTLMYVIRLCCVYSASNPKEWYKRAHCIYIFVYESTVSIIFHNPREQTIMCKHYNDMTTSSGAFHSIRVKHSLLSSKCISFIQLTKENNSWLRVVISSPLKLHQHGSFLFSIICDIRDCLLFAFRLVYCTHAPTFSMVT